MNSLSQKIKKTIITNNLIHKGDSVLVALSGGADSVVLLLILNELAEELGYRLSACHIEHGIRGMDSVRDMEFSKELCRGLGIDFYCKSFDVPSIAACEGKSVETAARDVRYGYFEELKQNYGFHLVATAHHRDDKAETVIMNILRGCSLKGFVGIEYKNGHIIRPLLDVSKTEILDYCRDLNISYCTDTTNDDTRYSRNKVRHKLIPLMKEFNPSLEDAIIRQGEIISQEDDYISLEAQKAYQAVKVDDGIDIKSLRLLHKAIRRRVIYLFLADIKNTRNNITFNDVDCVCELVDNSYTGKSLYLTDGVFIELSYGVLKKASDNDYKPYEYHISIGKPISIPEAGLKLTILEGGGNIKLSQDDSILIRNRRDGDRFYPCGMNGSKKIKDLFTDLKIPVHKRNQIPLLIVNDQIASVIGYRNDRRFFDTDGTYRLVVENI